MKNCFQRNKNIFNSTFPTEFSSVQYLMIILSNEFTQVHSQVDIAPFALHQLLLLYREQSYPKGRHISRLFGCFCLPPRTGSTRSSSTSLPGCCRGNRPGQAFLIRFHPTATFLPLHRWVFPGLEGGKCTRSEIFKRKKTRFHERHSFGFEASTEEGGRRDPTRIV